MPTLSLQIANAPDAPDALTPQRHQALAAALTAITHHTLAKRAEVTAVLIQGLPATQWFIGGQAVQQPTVMLSINVTAGTNTPAQKAAFIAAAHAELQRQLAPDVGLAPASYLVVHELPATDWGYGGLTQQARQPAHQQLHQEALQPTATT